MNRSSVILLVGALAVVAAACGAADSEGTTSTVPGLATSTTTSTSTTTTSPPATTPSLAPSVTLAPGRDDVVKGMIEGAVFLDAVSLQVMESFPVQVSLALEGSLPTPCHRLSWRIAQPDIGNSVFVEVFSLVDPNQACIQRIEPFEETISLGTFPQGDYRIVVNGESLELSV